MTHSLHRTGSETSLKKDYVFLCTPAKGVNNEGARDKLIKILDIIMEVGPTNIGFYGYGSKVDGICIEDIKKRMHDNSRLRCCFDDREKLKEVLKRIKAEEFGLSITVSGLISEILEISKDLSLTPHTVNISCGVFGKVNYLPDKRITEITTMCGHGMVGYRLTEDTIDQLKKGEIDLEKAIHTLQKPCTCGIFNPTRAREILQRIIYEEDDTKSESQRRSEADELGAKIRVRPDPVAAANR